MNRARSFLIKHLPTLSVVGLVIVAAGFFWYYRSDAVKAQAVGALFSFFAAAILVGVTWEYVRINQKSLALQQAQWEQQNRVVLRFGVRRYHGGAQVWVANIGKIDFLILELRVRLKSGETIVKNERRIVRSGARQTLSLPDRLWRENPLISAFDVQLRFDSQNESGLSSARAFTLLVGTNAAVIRVRRGLDDDTWFVNCPKCGKIAGSMITENLDNFDAAFARRREMDSELKVSCPEHWSQWNDSVEQVRARRENETEPPSED